MSWTLFLADDHPIVRQGLKALLRTESDFQLVGESADGLDTVRQVERLKPDAPRAASAPPDCRGPEQRAGCQATVHQPAHRRESPHELDAQARRTQSARADSVRAQTRYLASAAGGSVRARARVKRLCVLCE